MNLGQIPIARQDYRVAKQPYRDRVELDITLYWRSQFDGSVGRRDPQYEQSKGRNHFPSASKLLKFSKGFVFDFDYLVMVGFYRKS